LQIGQSLEIAIAKDIAIKHGDRNIGAYILVLGNISSGATTFRTKTLTEGNEAGRQRPIENSDDPIEVGRISARVVSEDFASATGNTIIVVIWGGTLLP